jgi:hypothetical protein
VLRPARLTPTRLANPSNTRALASLNRNPSNSRLGVSPSKYQSNSIDPSPNPRPGPGSRPVMYPSTDTDNAVMTLLISLPQSLAKKRRTAAGRRPA